MSGMARALAALLVGALGGCAYNAREHAAGWSLAETAHVRVYTTVDAARAAELADQMQRIRDIVAGAVLPCAFHSRSHRIVVAVLRPAELRAIVPRTTGAEYRTHAVSWIPDLEKQIVMADELDRETRRVYQHELTHYLVDACFPRVPTWLDEGLAGFLETLLVDDGIVLIGLPPYYLPRGPRKDAYSFGIHRSVRFQVVERERLPRIAKVTALSPDQFYLPEDRLGRRRVGHYAVSWALVHMLEVGAPDLTGRFNAFLVDLRRPDADPAALLAKRFRGIDLQERLDRYIRLGSWPYVPRSATVPRSPAPARVRALTAGEAHLQWARLWAGAPASEEARRRRAMHLAAASAREDSRVRAHLLSAAGRAVEGDLAGAEREVRDAMRVAPRDPELLHALVELQLERRADPTAAAARLREVARTGEQLCALAAVDLRLGRPDRALSLAMRGLAARPSSDRCRRYIDLARAALRRQGAAAR